jgi:hypothetical protein
MTGIRPPPRRGTRPCGLLLPASQAIGAITASAKACGEFSRALQEKHQRSDNIWRPLAYRCSIGVASLDRRWIRRSSVSSGRPAGDERRGGDSCLGCDRRRARAGARRGPGRSPASCFGMSRVSVSFRRAAAVEGRPRAALESQPATTTGSKLASCGPHSAWRDATMAYASQFRYSDRRRSPAFTPERLRRFHHVKSAAAAPVAARSPRRNQVGI